MPEHQPMSDLQIVRAPTELDFIQIQSDLQERIGRDTTPAVTLGELHVRLREEKEAIDQEFAEIWDLLPWKHWKSVHRANRQDAIPDVERLELKYELIDIFHFVLNMCIILGMDWQEFCDLYVTKMRENHDRQDRGY
jgi:hypothetical protein